jgi:hypothetical protein
VTDPEVWTLHFTSDISVGSVVAALSLGFGLWRAHVANQRRLGAIENQLEMLMRWYNVWVSRQMGRSSGDD